MQMQGTGHGTGKHYPPDEARASSDTKRERALSRELTLLEKDIVLMDQTSERLQALLAAHVRIVEVATQEKDRPQLRTDEPQSPCSASIYEFRSRITRIRQSLEDIIERFEG